MMSTSTSTTSGLITAVVNWNEYNSSDSEWCFQPEVIATSSSPVGDPSITNQWDLTVDGVTVTSGSGYTSYYPSGTGTGPVVLDVYSVRYVERIYGQTRTVRLWQRFGDFYGASGKTLTLDKTITVPARPYELPANPSAFAAASNGSSVSLSWTTSSTTASPYDGTAIDRSSDGGATWQRIATLGASATGYTDSSVSSDGRYSYMAFGINSRGMSSGVQSAYVYTTPSAPGTPTAVKTSGTVAQVSWAKNSSIATSTTVQRRTNGGAWSDYATVQGDSYNDTSASSAATIEYRVRNNVASLQSAYSAASNAIVAIAPPAAPTVLNQNNAAAPDNADYAIAWVYNPMDGSAQTKYQIAHGDSQQSMVEESAVTSSEHTAAIDVASGYSVGDTVYYKVRTWGLDSTAGAWSSVYTLRVLDAPSVSITSPAGSTVTSLPLAVSWSFTDTAYSQASASMVLSNGQESKSYSLQGSGSSFTVSDWTPANGSQWTIAVNARSSSTLTATASKNVTVDYSAPAVPAAAIIQGSDCSAIITVHEGTAGSGELATDSISLYRVAGGVETLIASGLDDGGTVTDRVPPLDTQYAYKVLAISTLGFSTAAEVNFTVRSGGNHVINYGQSLSSAISICDNATLSEARDTDCDLWWGAGAALPVLLNGVRNGVSFSIEGTSHDTSESARLDGFMDTWHGPAVLRVPCGGTYDVVVTGIISRLEPGGFSKRYTINAERIAG